MSESFESRLYRKAEALYRAFWQPGTGLISDATDLDVLPDGRKAVFSATLVDKLEGVPPTRICSTDLETGDTRVLTFGPNCDRAPKFSPNGRQLAFLSDRRRSGDFQLHLLDLASGAAREGAIVPGWVEDLRWSPDGKRIALRVAGHGADIAGAQGAITSRSEGESPPAWMPSVVTAHDAHRWRRAWVYELDVGSIRQVSKDELNVWEVAWCGTDRLVAVASTRPDEGGWYAACLHLIDIATGASEPLYVPSRQLGWPAASPRGCTIAIVEAICSDRGQVAGDLLLIDVASGKTRSVDTRGVDVTHVEWRSDQRLLLAGLRGLESVVGVCDVGAGVFSERWSSREISTSSHGIKVAGCNDRGDCVLIGEGFSRAPEVAVIRNGGYKIVRSFDSGYTARMSDSVRAEALAWSASDGLEIQGWCLRPQGSGPHPLILQAHGGPVSNWRSTWLSRPRTAHIPLLLEEGYAVLLPNPRGSAGRGQSFAARVLGDMGGADSGDCLTGIDELVTAGIADPNRLGICGGSYGGFMTAWLITQDARFAAAVALAPVTNYVTEHLVSNIPDFVRLFLGDSYSNPTGKYFSRSPVMHAHKVRTPTLNICGALDRCTPPQEAAQFHHALLEYGVESELVTYPEEGHGIRKFPAAIDYAARLVSWFLRHMPADARPSRSNPAGCINARPHDAVLR